MQDAIIVRLRGNIILVQNLTLVVKLCLPMNAQSSLVTLQWFLSEIQKDLKDLRDAQRAKTSSAASSANPCDKQLARQEELGVARQEQLVDGILEGLLTHPRCAKALWLPSRSCFRVKKKDVAGKAGQKDFFVRKGPRFWPALQQAGDFALDFLERPDPDEEAGSDSGPDALEIISEAPGEGPVAGPVAAYGHSGNLDAPTRPSPSSSMDGALDIDDELERELTEALEDEPDPHWTPSNKRAKSGPGAGRGSAPDIVD